MTTEPALPRAGLAARAAAMLVLCCTAWVAFLPPALPQPAGANAPATRFSATRAMRHVHAIAQTPRPVASSMDERARGYIVRTLREMGLEPQIQTATVHRQDMDDGHNVHVTLAVVHNIVVLKPGASAGHEHRPALLLAAHYDSDANTLGAADGAPAAAMLETLRALQAAPPLPEDAVFLFADADRVGQLGEQAFAEQHPLAQRVGLSLRFSSLGNQGALQLYDTSGAAGEAVRRWANAAPAPAGSSFMRELHRLGQTNVDPLDRIGAPSLHLATVQGWLGLYDTRERLSPRTLQHLGDTMLALAREFAGASLANLASQPDAAYFGLSAAGVIVYPAWLIWPLTCLACLLVAAACALALRGGRATGTDLAKGAFGFLLIAAGPLAALYVAGQTVPVFPLAHDASGLPEVRHLAMEGLLLLCLSIVLHRWLRARVGASAAALGAQLAVGFLLLPLTFAMAGASQVLAWPLIVSAAALAAFHARPVAALRDPLRLMLLVAGLAAAILLMGPALREVLEVPSPARVLLGGALLALLAGLGSLIQAILAGRFAARTLALAGVALAALPGTATAPMPALPVPNPLVYYRDMQTWSEWWLARTPSAAPWMRSVFPLMDRPRRLVDVFGWDSDDLWYARAQRSETVSFPYAILLKNDPPPQRHIEFELTSKNRAPQIDLALTGGKPWRASVNGREITNDDQIRNWSLSVYGMEDRKLSFAMDLVGAPYLLVHVEERMPGVPAQAVPHAVPRTAFIPMTGQTVAADVLVFR